MNSIQSAKRVPLLAFIAIAINLASPAWQPTQAREKLFATAEATQSSEIASSARKIAFFADPGTKQYFLSGTSNCYVINADGSNLTQITHYNGDCSYPVWSPDGKRIAFVSYQNGETNQIYSVNPDGSDPTKLSNLPPSGTDTDIFLDWSPDGKYIAYSTRNGQGHYQIYRMNADGSNLIRLTNGSQYVDRRLPVWSPDNKKIAFVKGFDSDVQIEVVNADGSHLTPLTGGDINVSPAWSPDSKHIIYLSVVPTQAGETSRVYIMDANGSHVKRVTNQLRYNQQLSWSPDGKQVLFAGEAAETDGIAKMQIFVMDADGTNLTQLTQTNGSSPRWSPDGKQVTFLSIQLGSNLFVMNRDGSHVMQLTKFVTDGPAWQPDVNNH